MEREGGKEEGTGALGGESGQRGRKGRRKQEEENRRVIQGRRYSLPGMAARRQESCCVRSLCQIGEKGREGEREGERVHNKVVGLDCPVRYVCLPVCEYEGNR